MLTLFDTIDTAPDNPAAPAPAAPDGRTAALYVTAGRIAELETMTAAVNKRLARAGCNPVRYTIGETPERRTIQGEPFRAGGEIIYPAARVYLAYPVTVHIPELLSLPGWTLAGMIEHTSAGNLLTYLADGVTIPERYRSAAARCDHCRTNRRRNDTFVVRHESGEFKQIGRQCLSEYLGIDAAAAVRGADIWVNYSRWIDSIKADLYAEDSEPGEYAHRVPDGYELARVVEMAAHWSAVHGYVSIARAETDRISATAHIIDCLITGHPRERYNELIADYTETAAGADLARRALDWLAALDPADRYQRNLKEMHEAGIVSGRLFNVAVSIIGAYYRAERAETPATGGGRHIGTPGERITLTVHVDRLITIDGVYGVSILHKMSTADGAALVWFASNPAAALADGETVTITGTVKEHGEFNGQAQTKLTRVKPCKIQRRTV